MSISRAYEWLKANLPEFEGAEDVEDGETEEYEVSGEEFLSMLEEVL